MTAPGEASPFAGCPSLGLRQMPWSLLQLEKQLNFPGFREGVPAGECVHAVQASFVPLCKCNLHVSWSSSWTDPQHSYFVAKAGGQGLVV